MRLNQVVLLQIFAFHPKNDEVGDGTDRNSISSTSFNNLLRRFVRHPIEAVFLAGQCF